MKNRKKNIFQREKYSTNKLTENALEKMFSIPKIIHFIWAGGTYIMPVNEMEVVSKWAQKNPEFKVYLWVEKNTANEDMPKIYEENFTQEEIIFYDELLYIEENSQTKPTIILKDINNAKLRDECITYEIDKLTPNYGASSDLLRYKILFMYGGAYFDSDVEPGTTSLNEICSKTYNKHTLFIEHHSQKPEVTRDELRQFTVDIAGNDSFICTAANPLINAIASSAIANYTIDNKDGATKKIVELAHMGKNIQDLTVFRTGPIVVQTVLKDSELKENYREKEETLIYRIRDGITELAVPKENTANWLNAARVSKLPLNDALHKLEKTIGFEATHFHNIRLDDHIDDLMVSCNDEKLEPFKAFSLIEKMIGETLKNKIEYYQLTGKYAESIKYCKSNNLLNLFDLNKEIIDIAIIKQAYLDKFIAVKEAAKTSQVAITMAEENGTTPEIIILFSQTDRVKKDLCRKIEAGSEFMLNIIRNIDQFTEEKTEILNFIGIHLQDYITYGDALNNEVEEEYNINIDKICEDYDNITKEVNKSHTYNFNQ
jgi:hypothetical protein